MLLYKKKTPFKVILGNDVNEYKTKNIQKDTNEYETIKDLIMDTIDSRTMRFICNPVINVDPYIFFCLRSIITVKVERILKRPVTVKFFRISLDSEDIYLVIYTPVEIKLDIKNEKIIDETIENILNKIIKGFNYCLLFRYDIELDIDGIHIPQRWLSDAIYFSSKRVLERHWSSFKNYYNSHSSNRYFFSKEGDVYVKLDSQKERGEYNELDFITEYDNLQREILSTIKRWFRKGTVFLDPEEHKEFIQKWKLKPLETKEYKKILDTENEHSISLENVKKLEESQESQRVKKYKKIFQATWFDMRPFSEKENMTTFLLNRMNKNYLFIKDLEFESPLFKTEIIKKQNKKGTLVFIDNIDEMWSLLGHLRHVMKRNI